MIDFTSLYTLSGLLFIAILGVFLLAIYKFVSTGKLKSCIAEITIFTFLIIIISYVAGATLEKEGQYENIIPNPVIIAVSSAFIIYAVTGLIFQRRKNNNSLSPSSVKEALDNLNSGICFVDESGKIVLINYVMGSLISSALNSYPQTLDDIKGAVNSCKSIGKELYKFNDSRIWQVNASRLEEFTQISAQDVTELYEANIQLEKDNERLRETNEEMQRTLERLADRIREQETLNLKIQIHNDIGTSLIAITKIMNGKADEPIDGQLRLLQNAVGYFSTETETELESVIKSAQKLGVKLIINGETPKNSMAQRLISLAARECTTNCVKHANGNTVFINISGNIVSFKNNGDKPKGKIIEGSGLSSLRRSIENENGNMTIESIPEFELILKLPEKEN